LIKHETFLWKSGTKKEFLDWKDEYFYEEKNSELVKKQIAIFDEFPNKYRHYTYQLAYKFDEKGNWIKQVLTDKKNKSVTKRKIVYYE
jgi:hypothetical protein